MVESKFTSTLLPTPPSSILRVLHDWTAPVDGGGGDNTEKAGDGMVKDGALALSSLSTSTAGNGSKDWISHGVMKEVCPSVTFGDYQLIGVNWMALLHRSTFDLGDGKGGGGGDGGGKKGKGKKGEVRDSGMNVNGVLADEMGLGKTGTLRSSRILLHSME